MFCVYRKQGELEKLNQSTDDINRWESELEVRHQHRQAAVITKLSKLTINPKYDLFNPVETAWQFHHKAMKWKASFYFV